MTTPDDLYEALVGAQRGLDAEGSLLFANRLALLLMERVGDPDAIRACIEAARLDPPAGSAA